MFSPFNRFFYVLAYLAVLYIRPHEFAEAWAGLPVLPVLLGTSFVLWLWKQEKNFEAPQFRLMPLLLLMCILSVIASGWLGGGFKAFSDFAPVVVLFFILATSVDSMQRLRQVFVVLSVSAVVMSVHGIQQWAYGSSWTSAQMIEGRITYLGFLNDPNDLAMALLLILPMLMYLARHAGFWKRWTLRCGAAAVVYAVYLTNSRGATLALGAMLLTYGIWRYGVWRSLMVVPVLLLPLILFAPSRMSEMSADEESAEGRIEAWYEGFQMVKQHPIFGVGKGMFVDHNILTAHNSFVLALAELGIFGYFIWFSILVLTWLMLRRVNAIKSIAPKVEPEPWHPMLGVPVLKPLPANRPGPALYEAPPVPQPIATTVPPAKFEWDELRAASRTLWVGYVGGLVSAFFLSRSYVVILYVHVALIVAVYQLARKQYPELDAVRFRPLFGRMLVGCIGSTFTLWVVTRILLILAK